MFEAVNVFAVETPRNYKEVLDIFIGIFNSLIPIIIGIALLVFVWGVVKFLSAGGSEDSVDSAKKLMFWGVIIIFVMVSFWGIVQFFYSDFFDGRAGIPVLPEGDPARDIDITNDSF